MDDECDVEIYPALFLEIVSTFRFAHLGRVGIDIYICTSSLIIRTSREGLI